MQCCGRSYFSLEKGRLVASGRHISGSSGFIKCREFAYGLGSSQLPKGDCAPCTQSVNLPSVKAGNSEYCASCTTSDFKRQLSHNELLRQLQQALPQPRAPSPSIWNSFFYLLDFLRSWIIILLSYRISLGPRGSVVGWGTMLQPGGSRVRIPMRSLDYFSLLDPSSRTNALGTTQPVREMSAKNISGAKGRPARKADNLTASCVPIV
jgi:hypothetical protein